MKFDILLLRILGTPLLTLPPCSHLRSSRVKEHGSYRTETKVSVRGLLQIQKSGFNPPESLAWPSVWWSSSHLEETQLGKVVLSWGPGGLVAELPAVPASRTFAERCWTSMFRIAGMITSKDSGQLPAMKQRNDNKIKKRWPASWNEGVFFSLAKGLGNSQAFTALLGNSEEGAVQILGRICFRG